jgi:hypothetical protein
MTTPKIKNNVRLVDVLANWCPDSGASQEYNKGIAVGVVSTLMAMGYAFDAALAELAKHAPSTFHVPDSWTEDYIDERTSLSLAGKLYHQQQGVR